MTGAGEKNRGGRGEAGLGREERENGRKAGGRKRITNHKRKGKA